MVSTRSKGGAQRSSVERSSKIVVGEVGEVGAAFTSPADAARIRTFRALFLSRKRTWRDRLSTFWAQVEVHSGAYMFDVREHVIFYALVASLVYLVGKSLVALVVQYL